jgi:hypothetical protein
MDINQFKQYLALVSKKSNLLSESISADSTIDQAAKNNTMLDSNDFKKIEREIRGLIRKNIPSDAIKSIEIDQHRGLIARSIRLEKSLRCFIDLDTGKFTYRIAINRQYERGSKWNFSLIKTGVSGVSSRGGWDMLKDADAKSLEDLFKKISDAYQKYISKNK